MKILIGFQRLALLGLLVTGLLGTILSAWSYIPTLPTVKITASDPNAAEDGPNTGTFTVMRTTEDLTVPLTVYFKTPTGTAQSATDYQTLSGWVTIAAYATATNLTVTPILDSDCGEGSETVVLTLATNSNYWVGWPSNATVTIADAVSPTITTALTNQVVCPGANVTFQIVATGTGPLTNVWKHNGVTLTGQTGNSLVLPDVSSTNAGTYQISVSGHCGSVNSSATLTVLTNLVVGGPTNQAVRPGSVATFVVTVSGTGPFTYQWIKNVTNLLSGQTTSSLVLTNVSTSDVGTYAVGVSGVCSSLTNSASLTVLPPSGLGAGTGVIVYTPLKH